MRHSGILAIGLLLAGAILYSEVGAEAGGRVDQCILPGGCKVEAKPKPAAKTRTLVTAQPTGQRGTADAIGPSTAASGEASKPRPSPSLSPVCIECPHMVAIPAGQFVMGSPDTEAQRSPDEGPTRTVAVSAFELGKTEVTVGEYAAFIKANPRYDAGNSCGSLNSTSQWVTEPGHNWKAPPFVGFAQTDQNPVVCVNWNDAQAYVEWLNTRPGSPGNFRLPTEAEWEYAARAGTQTARYWGESPRDQCRHGNGGDKAVRSARPDWPYGIQDCDDGYPYTAPVGKFEANAWGLKDMLGNSMEWVQDCSHPNYRGAPNNSQAWEVGGDCTRRLLRGGAWNFGPWVLRAANRASYGADNRLSASGFRLARTVSP